MKHTLRTRFLAAGLSILMLVGASGAAMAAQSQQDLKATFRDIQINIQGEKISPKDAAGKPVEPFIVDGTTYLPVRAVGEALGLNVSWDGSTSTVSLDGFVPYYQTSKDYDVIPLTMSMQAGSAFFETYEGGGVKTIHSGVGYMDPFGVGSYHAGIGYPEAEKFPKEQYASDWFMDTFATDLFCIYHLADGDIYAWDGIFGANNKDASNFKPAAEAAGTPATRGDVLVNVIVGGTGAYEGATGILVGTTSGAGPYGLVDNDSMVLPQTLFKLMEGYIKIPKDPSKHQAPAASQPLNENYETKRPQEYAMIQMEMRMQAGSAEYEPVEGADWTIHSGIGLMKPFGSASYHMGFGFPEAKELDVNDYLNENFQKEFGTDMFCVYHIDNGDVKGDLYVYDGIFGAMLEDSGTKGSSADRQDALVNIVIGGTGDFEGATGIFVGRTRGAGDYAACGTNPFSGDEYTLPQGLLKLMDGYIKVPASSPAAAYRQVDADLITG